MGYCINYGPQQPKKQSKIWKNLRFQIFTAVFLLLFVAGVRQMWPEGTQLLRECLLPGPESETQAAFETLVERVKEGEPFGDALTAFCQEIIEDADLAE